MKSLATVCGQLRDERTAIRDMKQVFKLMDKDGDGFVNIDEFLYTLALVGLKELVSPAEAKAAFAVIDKDQSGAMDMDEFLQLMRLRTEITSSSDEMIRAFETLSVGTASKGLGRGEAHMSKIREWLELYRPQDAKLSTNHVMNMLELCKSDTKAGVTNFIEFIDMNS
eukprot:TRINITY_DN20319_c0_g1_i1.p1 TRINITY_DN20319_c0_g1~~TRINITY_DN20319_c0_g1_i1.p1  ORF type:complete len:168 (+),score=41.42 TRINITY_DN20319_c0_g1_i1:250-753(+)